MNKVKKAAMVVVCSLFLAAGWASLATAAEIEVEGDAYIGVFDKYLWRGFDLSGSRPVVQGGVDLSAKGFTLSYWSNIQLASDEADGFTAEETTETDIILDYSFDLNDMVWVSIGDMLYIVEEDFPNTHELYLGFGLNTILEPSFTMYYDWDEAQEDGLFYTASVGHTFELNESLSVNLGGLVSYNQKSDFNIGDYSDWHNAEFNLGIDYAVTDQISLSPSFLYSTPMSDEAEDIAGIDDEVLGGVTVLLAF